MTHGFRQFLCQLVCKSSPLFNLYFCDLSRFISIGKFQWVNDLDLVLRIFVHPLSLTSLQISNCSILGCLLYSLFHRPFLILSVFPFTTVSFGLFFHGEFYPLPVVGVTTLSRYLLYHTLFVDNVKVCTSSISHLQWRELKDKRKIVTNHQFSHPYPRLDGLKFKKETVRYWHTGIRSVNWRVMESKI